MSNPFTVYSSSAGSGKTTRLVCEYLKLCFKSDKSFEHIYRNILAITFTNNATVEMKERILKTLELFAFSNPPFKGNLQMIYSEVKEFSGRTDEEMCRKSQSILEQILYHFDDFSISTIDSFFQRILRAFAFELNLNMNFKLEIQLDDLVSQTIDLLINKVSKEDKEKLTERVLILLRQSMEESGQSRLESQLQSILYKIFDEDTYYVLKDFDYTTDSSKSFFEKYLDYYSEKKKSLNSDLSTLESILSQSIEKKNGGKLTNSELRSKLMEKIPEVSDATSFVGKVQKMSSIKVPKNTDNSASFENYLQEYYKLLVAYQEVGFVSKNLYLLSLMFDLKNIMEDIKVQDNLFYLSETNSKIADEIEKDETPFIYEKMGNKYAYFFIDEFQDTSKLQWDNFIPLLKNALSGLQVGNERGEVKIFGDVKQAIYRFRSGESKLLYDLYSYEGVKKQLDLVGDEPDFFSLNQSLNTNHRSSKSIVLFNNSFFRKLLETSYFNNDTIRSYYFDLKQELGFKAENENGFVSILFKSPNFKDALSDYYKMEAENAIHECVDKYDFEYKDIAVLTSSNDLGSIIGDYLLRKGIPVISSDSLLLSSSDEINLIEAALSYLADGNFLSKIIIARYVTKNSGVAIDDIIAEISADENSDKFYQYLLKYKIDFNRSKLLPLQLFTLVKELIRIFQLSEMDPFVVKFLDCLDDYLSKKSGELTLFLDWWKEKSKTLSLAFPKDLNAVTITTIHKSKGLAYPVVIFPFDSYSYRKTKETVWLENKNKNPEEIKYFLGKLSAKSTPPTYQDAEQEETILSHLDLLNKLYVAHTRAEDALYILTGKSDSKSGSYASTIMDLMENDHGEDESLEDNPTRYWFINGEFFNTDDSVDSFQNHQKEEPVTQKISQIYASDFLCSKDDFALSEHQTEQQKRGVYIHDFFSSLKDFPQSLSEIETVVEKLASDYKESVKQYLSALINDSRYAKYFSKGLKLLNERTILCENGKMVRPDRIVFFENEVVVLDYKTGKSNEESKLKYEAQIAAYCDELRKMGYANVRSEIIYLEELCNAAV